MTEVFVVPCSNRKAQEHFYDTVVDGVSRDRYDKHTDGDAGEKPSIWGVSPGADRFLDKMSTGDYLLFYTGDNRYEYAARVTGREFNEQLAADLWTEYEVSLRENNDELWPNIIYLTEPTSVDIDSREVHHDHAGHKRGHPQNFMRLTGDAVRSIEQAYGSTAEFVSEHATETSETAVRIESRELTEQVDRTPELEEDPSFSKVRRRARSSVFAREVKQLYDHTCAICGTSRRSPDGVPEVEAAHIYPKSENGADDIRNGLALCKLHHWAFDAGWFVLQDDYTVLVRDCEDVEGYDEFARFEGREIHLPTDERKRPARLYLREHRVLHGFGDD